jgi:transposase
MQCIHFIGIDVSKEWFDVCIHGGPAKPERYDNGGEGFAAFASCFAGTLPEALVVLEATGGYEAALIAFLLKQGVAVHRADPLTAKHFLRSLRLRGKTDALDAAALARYAAERHKSLALMRLKDAEQEELALLLSRRADLVAGRVAEQNRLGHPRYLPLRASLNAIIRALADEIDVLERRIEALVAQSQALAARLSAMTGVKGVGKQTAYTLLACMPELGSLTRRQAASLAGVAPHPRDSGKSSAYRKTAGGRAAVKRALFMAALSATRFNPELKQFYQRLRQNGKKPMVALTAAMRKLITILNAKIRDAKLATSR